MRIQVGTKVTPRPESCVASDIEEGTVLEEGTEDPDLVLVAWKSGSRTWEFKYRLESVI